MTDAYLAALAIEHGCELVTTDGDFARFQLRALDRAQRQLRHAWWEARSVSWEDRDPQERAFLSIRPLGSLWKQVGRKMVKRSNRSSAGPCPASVRFPPALYEEVTAYPERLGPRPHLVIVESSAPLATRRPVRCRAR